MINKATLRRFNQDADNEDVDFLRLKHGTKCLAPFHVVSQTTETILGNGTLR